jgi:murein DD-endopeptidase MepM/ murein hydrolase activator NlpD
LRLQAHATRRHRAPRLVTALLAVPVLAQVYLGVANQRLSSRHPAVLVGCVLAASLAIRLVTGPPAVARPSSVYRPYPAEAFRPLAQPPVDSLDTSGSAVDSVSSGAPSVELDVPPVETAVGAPAIVRFRPRAGQIGISRLAAVSVRFTQPMDHASTERAFRPTLNGKAIKGEFVWAEGDTVLVLIPSYAFPYGARIRLAATADARSAEGEALSAPSSVTFAVIRKPSSTGSTSSSSAGSVSPGTSTPATSGWRWPLIGPITQYFGQHLTKYGFHNGIDIDGDTGDPVVAARSGRVVVAGYYDACGGLQVHIDHGNGLESWYRHLSEINVRVGASVSGGTLIGRVGATGCALGSHLHFGIRRGTTFVDPLRYLPRR